MADEPASTPEGAEGQKLVRLPPRSPRPKAARRIVDPPPPPREDDEAPELTVPATDYHTASDDVPAVNPDPAWREKPTIGSIELTDDAQQGPPMPVLEIEDRSDGTLRTFEDLLGHFPIGDEHGQYFIHVERLKPNAYQGVAAKGVLRKITRRMSMEDFIEEYGGGEYQLIVYGPPKRGGLIDPRTQRIAPKALSKPIRLTVPYYGEGGHAPNPEASYEIGDDEERTPMREGLPGINERLLTRGATPANAKMVDSMLTHEREMHDRTRRDIREDRETEERQTMSALEVQQREAARREKLLQDQIQELKAERKERPRTSELESMSSVLRAVLPNGAQGDVASIREQHQREVERLEAHHRTELETVRRTAQQDRERLETSVRHERELMESRVRTVEQLASDRVKTLEERMERTGKDAVAEIDRSREQSRAEHHRAIEVLTREHERTVATMKDHYEQRLKDEERQRARDEEMRKQTLELQTASATTPLRAQISTLEAEVSRLKADVEHWKGEVKSKGDLARQVESFERTAGALGFTRDTGGGDVEAPKDWKSTVASVGLNLAQNLPQLLESAGKTFSAMRQNPGGMPAAMQGMPPGPPMMPQVTQPSPIARQAFATEDSGHAPPQLQIDPYPYAAQGIMPPPMPVPEQQQPPMPVASQQGVPMPAPPPGGQQIVPQGQMVAQGQQRAPAPPPAAAPSVAPPGPVAISPEAEQIVLGSRENIEQWLEGGVPVEQLAPGLVQQFTPAVIRSYLPSLTPEVVSAVLQKHGVASPLVKRKGQRYLRELHQAFVRALESAPS